MRARSRSRYSLSSARNGRHRHRAPLSPAGAAPDPLAWVGDNPLVSPVYAQSGQGQEPVDAAVRAPSPGRSPWRRAEPAPEQAEPAEPAEGPEPSRRSRNSPVEEAEPEPAAEPEPVTLGDFWGDAPGRHHRPRHRTQVTVGAAADALETARPEPDRGGAGRTPCAMEGQGEHNAGVRAAAQRLVDFVTATYLD